MIACVDVDYRDPGAVAACVVFADWPDEQPAGIYTAHIPQVQPYEPGQFYKRELPCLLEVLARVVEPLEVVVIDGHVWLAGEADPGLGARLHEALGRKMAVVGVAKSRFHGPGPAREVFRGDSQRPLYVTACGMGPDEAAHNVQRMHGAFRLPTLLRRVDRLCREQVV